MNVTETKIYNAFFNGEPLKLKHDSVLITRGCAVYQCWDSILAVRHIASRTVIYSKCGYDTKLTKDRLCALGAKCKIKDGVIVNPDNTPFFSGIISSYSFNL